MDANGGNPFVAARYAWGAAGLVSQRDNQGVSTWFHFGPQGETRQATNSAGTVIGTASYSPYGVPASTLATPFQFGSQFGYYTDYGNIILCGARWYDPAQGRWLIRDPIGYEGGENLYAYVGENPVSWCDPSGTDWTAIKNWYLGGMGGFSDLVDRHLMFGTTRSFGDTAGRYDSGSASAGEVIWAGTKFGGMLAFNGVTLGRGAVAAAGTRGGSRAAVQCAAGTSGWRSWVRRVFAGGCFAAGTPVHAVGFDGQVTTRVIEDLHEGDIVVSRSMVSGQIEAKRVEKTTVRTVPTILIIELADASSGLVTDRVTATPEHPFLVDGKGFVPASQIGIGTQIVARAGPALVVASISTHSRPEGYLVYNLEVADNHSFFVGSANGGVCVHNTGNECEHSVYTFVKGGVRYFGRTIDMLRRGGEHGADLLRIAGHMTLEQARGLEQALINKYGLENLLNKINSISPGKLPEVVEWGREWLRNNGLPF